MEEEGLCHLGIFLHCQRNSSGATVIVFADSLRQGNYTKNWANKLWKIHSRNCVFINMGKTGTCTFSKTENESKASTNREDQLFPELLLLDKAPWKRGSDWYLGGAKWKYIPRVQKKKEKQKELVLRLLSRVMDHHARNAWWKQAVCCTPCNVLKWWSVRALGWNW